MRNAYSKTINTSADGVLTSLALSEAIIYVYTNLSKVTLKSLLDTNEDLQHNIHKTFFKIWFSRSLCNTKNTTMMMMMMVMTSFEE